MNKGGMRDAVHYLAADHAIVAIIHGLSGNKTEKEFIKPVQEAEGKRFIPFAPLHFHNAISIQFYQFRYCARVILPIRIHNNYTAYIQAGNIEQALVNSSLVPHIILKR